MMFVSMGSLFLFTTLLFYYLNRDGEGVFGACAYIILLYSGMVVLWDISNVFSSPTFFFFFISKKSLKR